MEPGWCTVFLWGLGLEEQATLFVLMLSCWTVHSWIWNIWICSSILIILCSTFICKFQKKKKINAYLHEIYIKLVSYKMSEIIQILVYKSKNQLIVILITYKHLQLKHKYKYMCLYENIYIYLLIYSFIYTLQYLLDPMNLSIFFYISSYLFLTLYLLIFLSLHI